MTSQRITWFWPTSFLAALGQLLLLLTRNEGGPEAARLLLAYWTFALPGVGLGHLLTKPGTRLAARLPVDVSCALAVACLLTLLRAGLGAGPAFVPVALAALATVTALGFTFLADHVMPPRSRRSLRERRREGPLAAGLVLAAALAFAAWFAVQPVDPGIRPDGPAQIAAATAVGPGAEVFGSRPWDGDLGAPDVDAERGLTPALVQALARMAAVPPVAVWTALPVLGAPLLLLAAYLLGQAVLRRSALAAVAAFTALFVTSGGFAHPLLSLTAFADGLAWIPFWTALALYVEGQDDPHLPAVVAFGLAVLATWATHFGFGIALSVVLAAVWVRNLTSLERLQEGLPLGLALAVPGFLFTGVYLGARHALTGSVDPFGVPARGLLVWGPGQWTPDPAGWSRTLSAAYVVVFLFLPVFLVHARRRTGLFLLAAPTAIALLAATPWTFPWVERSLGAHVHRLPALVPVAAALVFLGEWAMTGLLRSRGHGWARILACLALLGVFVTGVVEGVGARLRPSPARAEPPLALARAVADTTAADDRLLAEPDLLPGLCARTDRLDALAPRPAWDLADARRRALAWRDVLDRAVADTQAVPARWDGFLRAVPADAFVAARRPPDTTATVLERRVLEHRDRFQAVRLDTLGTLFQIAPPGRASGLPSWVGAPPRSDRPPYGPATGMVDSVTVAPAVAPGDTLRVTVHGRRPADAADLDPRGYRVRVEWTGEGAGLPRPWRPPRSGWAEAPVAGGLPPVRWPDTWSVTVALPLPPRTEPGALVVRHRVLPGPRGLDRVRARAVFLDGAGTTVAVSDYAPVSSPE